MGKSKEYFMEQRESDSIDRKTVHKTFGDKVFKTIIGTQFVDLENITEIKIVDNGLVHKVDAIKCQSCSFEWAMNQDVKTWGVNSISIRPIRVIVDAIVEFTHNDEKCGLDVHFEHLNETAKFKINLSNYNPLINGIVPTGIVIKHKTDEIPQIQIQF